jgi:hypothetical protein
MSVVELPDAPDAVQRCFIADMATQCVSRIRRVDNNASRTHDIHRLTDQTLLGIVRMYLEELTHRSPLRAA